MITLIGIKLKNICQYDEFTADISTGLTAVVGRNGTGKTTLLRALVYALTGLVDGSWGTQQNLQKDGTSVVGYAEATVTDGRQYWSVRRFSTSNVKFADVVVDAELNTVASGRKKVNAFMETLFGMSCQLMFQICWGRQGELAYLLKATPSTVSTFLSMLFDTKIMERVREKLKLQIDTIAALPSDCEQQLANTESALAALESDDDIAAQDKCALDELQHVTARISALEGTAHLTPQEKADIVNARKADLDEATRKLSLVPAPAERMDVDLDANRCAYQREEVLSTISAVESQRTNALTMQMAHEKSVATLDAKIAELHTAMTTVNKAVGEGTGVCPLCGSTISDTEDYKAHVIGYLEPNWKGTLDDYISTVREKIESLTRQRSRDIELADGRKKAIAELDSQLKELYEARDWLDKVSVQLYRDSLVADAEAFTARLKEAEALIAWDDNTCSEHDALTRRRAELEALHNSLVRKASDTAARRELLTKYADDYRHAVQQYHINSDARQLLNEIRDAMSQSRAQARYLHTRITMLNMYLQRYVTQTGMPFVIKLDPDKRLFVYTTPDGVEHPAGHLSGAQQAMASVALQMAIFAVAEPNMNLYLIDEPTEACDDANKQIMAGMFEKMNAMLEASSGVMLIVARDEQTIASCANILEVGNA